VYDKTVPFGASIKWIKKETRDTSTYALRILDRQIRKDYCFKPGQFNMLSIPGIGEAAISISSSPADHDLLHTVRVAGDVTTALSTFLPEMSWGCAAPSAMDGRSKKQKTGT